MVLAAVVGGMLRLDNEAYFAVDKGYSVARVLMPKIAGPKPAYLPAQAFAVDRAGARYWWDAARSEWVKVE